MGLVRHLLILFVLVGLSLPSGAQGATAGPLLETPEPESRRLPPSRLPADPVGRDLLRRIDVGYGFMIAGAAMVHGSGGASLFVGYPYAIGGPIGTAHMAPAGFAIYDLQRRARRDLAGRGVSVSSTGGTVGLVMSLVGLGLIGVAVPVGTVEGGGYFNGGGILIGGTVIGAWIHTMALLPLGIQREQLRRGYLALDAQEGGAGARTAAARAKPKAQVLPVLSPTRMGILVRF